jgi:hypothetical protein
MIMVGNGKVGTQPTSTDAALPANTILAVQPSVSPSGGSGTNAASGPNGSRAAAGRVVAMSWAPIVGVAAGVVGALVGGLAV